MTDYTFELPMRVRDYECDLQGIVNNANYLHYLEHTRHEFLTSLGVNFSKLHDEGIDPVVARMNIAFKTPLHSGDDFISCFNIKKDGIKFVFHHDIFRLPDHKPVIKATAELVCLHHGKLTDSDFFNQLFAPYL